MKLPKVFNYSRTVMWIGLILVVYIFVILVNENSKNYQLRRKASKLEAENEQLQSEIIDLRNSIAYYNTDEYKEKVAREKLGLQKPGEQVVIVPEQTAQNSNEQNRSSNQTIEKKSNLAQWLEFLTGNN